MIVRRLWDAGLAHRDIKPANILVRQGQVFLIDPAFMQVRPSPWREAVDLANMMLVLAVRTDAERVYQRALRVFTPDEIAEAFAAARGVASPTQLRSVLKQDGRDLLAQFRALAPPRKPIALQRWSLYRVLLTAGLLLGTAIALAGDLRADPPRPRPAGDRRTDLRDRQPPAHPHEPGGTRIGVGAVRRLPARRLAHGRRPGPARRGPLLAQLGRGGRSSRRGDAPAAATLRRARRLQRDER